MHSMPSARSEIGPYQIVTNMHDPDRLGGYDETLDDGLTHERERHGEDEKCGLVWRPTNNFEKWLRAPASGTSFFHSLALAATKNGISKVTWGTPHRGQITRPPRAHRPAKSSPSLRARLRHAEILEVVRVIASAIRIVRSRSPEL